jgi:hypothetical protein
MLMFTGSKVQVIRTAGFSCIVLLGRSLSMDRFLVEDAQPGP